LSELTALLDACVLYPAPVRDLLIETADMGLYRARWTDDIHDEWIRNVLANSKTARPEALARTRALMNCAVPDALVTGYQSLIPTLTLPDPDDRHVLAAAIIAGADVIVTSNLKHFQKDTLSHYGIDAQHPDEFLMHQSDLNHDRFVECAKHIRGRLKNPPLSADDYLDRLRKCQLVLVAASLQAVRNLI
jgi:hypothetical protein